MLVNNFLENSAGKFPHKTALIFKDKRLSYLDIEQRANRFAHFLIEEGIERRERIGIFLGNSVESVVGIFGALKASAIFLVINPQIKEKKLAFILNDCHARVLLTDAAHFRLVKKIWPSCPHLKTVIVIGYKSMSRDLKEAAGGRVVSYSDICECYPSVCPEEKNIDIDLASLIYTSGSTGRPKAVMMTHLNMVSASGSIITYLENTSDDIVLNVLPLSFDYGLYQVLMAFRFGGTLVLEPVFIYAYKIIEKIIKEKVTGFPLVPTIATILLKFKNLHTYDFSYLRYITNTAQALPIQYIKKLQKLFPHTKIYSMYGLTECKRVSYMPPDELKKRPASVGKAMPNTEIYIVGEDGEKITTAGEVGELVVRGASVMKGYLNLSEETAEVLKPGLVEGEKVLCTGDLFKRDDEGFLYFMGRKDDLLKVSGERVSPKEIENTLHQMEGIIEAAVVGIEDEVMGQAIKVFVLLEDNSGLTERDIIRYCSRTAEAYMVPKYVEIIEKMPKSEHGKIDKKKLKSIG